MAADSSSSFKIQPQQEVILLLSVVLLAAGLRFYKLGEWSFWIDELFTLYNGVSLPQNLQTDLGLALREHPLSSGLIYTAVSLTQINEFNARLMPALVGILSIPILYRYVKKIFGAAVALLFALFLALAPWHLYWSQNARFYIAMLLLYWIAVFAFYDGFKFKKQESYLLCIICIILVVSERLLGLFIIPVLVLFGTVSILLTQSQAISWPIVAMLTLVGGAVAVFFGFDFIRDPALWGEIYGVSTAISPLRLFIRHMQAVDLHIIVLASVGAWHLFKVKNDSVYLWLAAVIVPLGITMIFALFQFTHPRYTFVTLIGWLILAAVGANVILQAVLQTGGGWVGGTAVILLFVLLPVTEIREYYGQNSGGRAELKAAFQYVNEQKKVDDIVFTNDDFVGAYYLPQHPPQQIRTMSDLMTQTMNCELTSDVWVIMNGNGRAEFAFLDWIKNNALRADVDFNNIKIYSLSPNFCLKVLLKANL